MLAAAVVGWQTVHGTAPTPGGSGTVGDSLARSDAGATAPGGAAAVSVPAAVVVRERTDTLARGETLVDLLVRAGVARNEAALVIHGGGALARRAPRPGLAVTTRIVGDSGATVVSFKPAVDRVVRLSYLAGAWHAAEEKLAWKTDTIAASGTIASTLFDALHQAVGDRLPQAKRSELVWRLADIFEYRVDVDRDLQRGDSLRVVVERRLDPEGTPHEARILAAALTVDGRPVEAIRYQSRRTGGGYFDQFGRSLRAAFLRAPVEFRRISSTFGMRQHPILGVWKMHKGTDYAAASGTPVRSVADGTVIFAGRKGGYGNVLEIRHFNGMVSRYGHLRAFARGIRRGSTVAIGKTVGYVGMTGLAAAPHLHFEMLVDGAQRDPRKTLRNRVSEPIPKRERDTFEAMRARLLGAAPSPSDGRTALAAFE